MSKILDALNKRRKHTVDLGDGDQVFIRAMKDDESVFLSKRLVPSTDPTLDISEGRIRKGVFLGCLLLNEDGTQLIERLPEESFEEFGARAYELFKDVPTDTIAIISKKAQVLAEIPTDEVLKKT
jgi:hypothetical protein